jgi:DNA-binding CsgD family transcriptional regulator
MNLSNKEIASLCNISSRGVEQSKYRLKKRLELVKDEDLSRFISQYKSQE